MKYGFPKSIVKAALAVSLSLGSAAVLSAAPPAVEDINRADSALAERVPQRWREIAIETAQRHKLDLPSLS